MFMDDATLKTRGKGNGVELLSTQRLKPFENREHNPESYEDSCTCLLTCSICRVIVKSTSSVALSLATLPRVNALAETERNVVMFVAVFGFVTASLFISMRLRIEFGKIVCANRERISLHAQG